MTALIFNAHIPGLYQLHLQVDTVSPRVEELLRGMSGAVELTIGKINQPPDTRPGEERTVLASLPEAAVSRIKGWVSFFEKNPNFRELVDKASGPLVEYLQEFGVAQPDLFYNLTAAHDAVAYVDRLSALDALLPERFRLAAIRTQLAEKFGKDVFSDPELVRVYHDQILQTIYDHLLAIQTSLVEADQQASAAPDRIVYLEGKLPSLHGKARRETERNLENLQQSLARYHAHSEQRSQLVEQLQALRTDLEALPLVRVGKISYRLARRDSSELYLGDSCSDCTSASVSGVNFWTVPIWLADPGMNFVLQHDSEGKLAHKFTVVWEMMQTPSGPVVMLAIDSSELANEQKAKAGALEPPVDLAKEAQLMADAITFFKGWLQQMGVPEERLYAATIANSGTLEYQRYPTIAVQLAKIGGVRLAEKTRQLGGVDKSLRPRVYLQTYGNAEAGALALPNAAEAALRQPDLQVMQPAEVALRNFLEDPVVAADRDRIQAIIDLAQTDYAKAARQFNVFLIMEAQPATQKQLMVEGKRLDVFLNNNFASTEVLFRYLFNSADMAMAANTMVGKFVSTPLYHLA